MMFQLKIIRRLQIFLVISIYSSTVLAQHLCSKTKTSKGMPPNTSRNTKTKTISTGETDFYNLALNHIFVDKSLLIRDLHYQTTRKLILFTRPRKFGKSTTFTMLRYFFQFQSFEGRHSFYDRPMVDVFDGLRISEYKTICEEQKYKYAVIYVDFKEADGVDELQVQQNFEKAVQNALHDHFKFLLKILKWRKGEIVADMDYEFLMMTQEEISKHHPIGCFGQAFGRVMKAYTDLGIPVIVLIDDYDVPFIAAYRNQHFEQTFRYVKPILVDCLKNSLFHKAYVTGTSTVAQQDVLGGLKSCSVIDKDFTSYFGFIKEDVEELIQKTQVPINSVDLDKWYNGYHFGKDVIFNPYSILKCLEEGELQPYWIRSGSSANFERLARLGGAYIQNHFDVLLDHETIEKNMLTDLNFYDLESDEESFWTLMVQAGYLNAVKEQPSSADSENIRPSLSTEDKNIFTLRIPNKEVYDELERIYNNISVNSLKTDINVFEASVIKMDTENIQERLTRLFRTPCCYLDFGTAYKARKMQVFIQGLLLRLRSKYHFVQITGNQVAVTILKPFDSTKQTIILMVIDQNIEKLYSGFKDGTFVKRGRWIQKLLNMNVSNMTMKHTILITVSTDVISAEKVNLLHHSFA